MSVVHHYNGVFSTEPLEVAAAQDLYFKIRDLGEMLPLSLVPVSRTHNRVCIGSETYAGHDDYIKILEFLRLVEDKTGVEWSGSIHWTISCYDNHGDFLVEDGKVIMTDHIKHPKLGSCTDCQIRHGIY